MATDDRPPQNVTYLDEIREPGEGWAQQDRFQRLIETIDDEDDYLAKFLRIMRMTVQPGMFDEDSWETVIIAAEAVMGIRMPFPDEGEEES